MSSIFATLRWMKSPRVWRGFWRPRQVWRLAPPRSASTSTTRLPRRASCHPRDAVRSDLPMPPFPPPTDQMRRSGRGSVMGGAVMAKGADMVPPLPSFLELHVLKHGLQDGPRLDRLLPYRGRGEGDQADRMPASDHREVPLPPFSVAHD